MTTTMTKGQLITRLKTGAGASLSGKKLKQLVNAVFASIQAEVLRGNTVSIVGFGSFTPRQMRTSGLGPSGVRWTAEPRTRLAFKPFTASGGSATGAKGRRKTTRVHLVVERATAESA